MAYIVSSPGSCGEFIQGYMDGISFMVTCPINRYSYAMSQFDGPGDRLPKKAALAVKKTLNYLGEEDRDIPIRLKSNILPGSIKGKCHYHSNRQVKKHINQTGI